MTEAEWIASTEPQKMLKFLKSKASDRKLRLFACACWSHWFLYGREPDEWPKGEDEEAVAVAYDFLENGGDSYHIPAMLTSPASAYISANDCTIIDVVQWPEKERQAALLRDIFGNPFRPIALDPALLTWNDGTIPKLAQGIYDERVFDRLPILADALEEAGCHDADILNHCRQPGEHVRGCWVVDLLLGKE